MWVTCENTGYCQFTILSTIFHLHREGVGLVLGYCHTYVGSGHFLVCQFTQIIGGAKGYSGPPTKLLGGGGWALLPPPLFLRLCIQEGN